MNCWPQVGSPPYPLAVCLGRFQPFHLGHLALLQRALDRAERLVVVIGSAFQARSSRDPFTWQERAEMIRLALPADEFQRLRILPMRDYYDTRRWARTLTRDLAATVSDWLPAEEFTPVLLSGQPDCPLLDLTECGEQGGLAELSRRTEPARWPAWQCASLPRTGSYSGSEIRQLLFAGGDELPAKLENLVPLGLLPMLRAWKAGGDFPRLAREWKAVRREQTAWAAAPYPPILVTVDALVRCRDHVLLIERRRAPGEGLLALPGGFLDQRETLLQAVLRELGEETRLAVRPADVSSSLVGTALMDHPRRSQRGRVVSQVYFFDLPGHNLPGHNLHGKDLPTIQAADDARAATWFPTHELTRHEERFHEDHFLILDRFLHLLPT